MHPLVDVPIQTPQGELTSAVLTRTVTSSLRCWRPAGRRVSRAESGSD
jgi:hypothetical protein